MNTEQLENEHLLSRNYNNQWSLVNFFQIFELNILLYRDSF